METSIISIAYATCNSFGYLIYKAETFWPSAKQMASEGRESGLENQSLFPSLRRVLENGWSFEKTPRDLFLKYPKQKMEKRKRTLPKIEGHFRVLATRRPMLM